MVVIDEKSQREVSDDKTMVYNYRLIESDIMLSVQEGRAEIKSYGIEVERQDFVKGKITNIERETVKVISPYISKVKEYLDILYKSMVSPIHCIDVLGEYIDECVCDFDREYLELAAN